MYLMDTHTLLWYLRNSQEISKKSLEIINSETTIFVSIASLWEIAIKNSIGKLHINESISKIEQLCNEKDISILPIKSTRLFNIKCIDLQAHKEKVSDL